MPHRVDELILNSDPTILRRMPFLLLTSELTWAETGTKAYWLYSPLALKCRKARTIIGRLQ